MLVDQWAPRCLIPTSLTRKKHRGGQSTSRPEPTADSWMYLEGIVWIYLEGIVTSV